MLRRFLLPVAGCLLTLSGANAQQGSATSPQIVAGQLFNEGFEVKAVINNTYLIMQKGDKAYWCGSSDPGLTWLNWAQLTRDAACVPLNK